MTLKTKPKRPKPSHNCYTAAYIQLTKKLTSHLTDSFLLRRFVFFFITFSISFSLHSCHWLPNGFPCKLIDCFKNLMYESILNRVDVIGRPCLQSLLKCRRDCFMQCSIYYRHLALPAQWCPCVTRRRTYDRHDAIIQIANVARLFIWLVQNPCSCLTFTNKPIWLLNNFYWFFYFFVYSLIDSYHLSVFCFCFFYCFVVFFCSFFEPR